MEVTEFHDPRAVGKLVGDGVCYGEGDPRLSDTSWSGDGN